MRLSRSSETASPFRATCSPRWGHHRGTQKLHLILPDRQECPAETHRPMEAEVNPLPLQRTLKAQRGAHDNVCASVPTAHPSRVCPQRSTASAQRRREPPSRRRGSTYLPEKHK